MRVRALLSAIAHTARAANTNDLADEAATMAFYFFLALLPFVVTVFAVTGILGGDDAFGTVLRVAQALMPQDAWPVVRDLVVEITARERPGLLSFGVLLTMWAASSGVGALIVGLNTIYAVSEPRPWWRRQLLALAMLTAGVTLIAVGTTIIVPTNAWLHSIGVGRLWSTVRWPVGAALVTGAIWLAYRYLPARDQRGAARETLVGALVATGLWMLAAVAFRFYLERFSTYGASYGALGSVIVLLLWFYLDAFVVLLGAQLAATLEHERVLPGPRGTVTA
jgi:membrane protein